MPYVYPTDLRETVAARLADGENADAIATAVGISSRTVYRLRRKLARGEGTGSRVAHRESISREQLLQLSRLVAAAPKVTLKELISRAVENGIFQSHETAPDPSTVQRKLVRIGHKWQPPRYSDPRAERTQTQYERCCFRKAQQSGLDPVGKILSMDETNFYFEQATRAWGTIYRAPVLEKPKGKIPRRVMFATIGFDLGEDGKANAFIHWVLVPPRKASPPAETVIQEEEVDEAEEAERRKKYTEDCVRRLGVGALKQELRELGIRSERAACEAMREVLLRVGQSGSRVGELKARGRGRPYCGGPTLPASCSAQMTTEYLVDCLGTYLGGKGLLAEDTAGCAQIETIKGCPDGGKREWQPDLGGLSLLWDNAPSHQPTTPKAGVTPFHRLVRDKIGLKGVIHTPPYSPWFNPVEYFFSYVKRYVRKFAPADLPGLLLRIREATAKVTGDMIAGWFRKAGFIVERAPERAADPNAGVVDRCRLPKTARFHPKDHVVCMDAEGVVHREKKTRRRGWSKYDSTATTSLLDVSVTARSGVGQEEKPQLPRDCRKPERTRWVGLTPEPAGIAHRSSSSSYPQREA